MLPLECLKRFNYSHIWKNAPFSGGHVLQKTRTIFELIQDIIRTIVLTKKNTTPPTPGGHIIGKNFLTKFHDDRTINVAYSGHVFKPTGTIFELIQYIIGTNL
ncbi:hypothetical protein DPMN_082764 [Dreissena polymorpha]|uniref:Uncharacterized protein n=1 Tax=Dreissena polymorpha TaxID=45954 RepID=A0A9D3Y8N6_DREPO|nr:hypothetical protein DPMN_082764 [Dreissena polymorpha]